MSDSRVSSQALRKQGKQKLKALKQNLKEYKIPFPPLPYRPLFRFPAVLILISDRGKQTNRKQCSLQCISDSHQIRPSCAVHEVCSPMGMKSNSVESVP